MQNARLTKSRKEVLLLGSGASYGALAVISVVGLISVPIGLRYFGPARYGVWLVISSILSYLSLSNFGIGAAVRTLVSRSPDPPSCRTILRRSMALLAASSAVFMALLLLVSRLLPDWTAIFGQVPAELLGEATTATLGLAILLLLRLPFSAFAPAFAGLQEIHWEQLYGSLGAVVSLAALIATIALRGNLVLLALFTGGGNLLVGIASGVHLLSSHRAIRLRLVQPAAGAPSSWLILTCGSRFLLMGIVTLIISNTSNLIISRYLGPQAVTTYGVTFKLFAIGFSVITTVNLVLWPMYARAASSGQWEWVERVYNHFCHLLAVLGGLLWMGGVAFAEEVIDLWAGPAGYAGLRAVMALGAYGYVLSLVNTHVMVLNGLNRNRNVITAGALEAVANVMISLALVGVLGVGGVALGMFIAAALTSFWLLPLDVSHQTTGKVKFHPKPLAIHATTVLLPALAAIYLLSVYGPAGWTGVIVKVIVILFYLGLSWRVSPSDLRDLIWKTTKELLAHARTTRRSSD